MRIHPLWKVGIGASTLLGSLGFPITARAQEQIVEKIPLQYVDARYVAYLLGGRTLPTEADLWMGRMGGFGVGNLGPLGGGTGPGNGVLADPATNSIFMLQGGRLPVEPQSRAGVYGDPRTNSLLIGPQFGNRGGGTGGNRLFGVPGSNSLLYRYQR
jgi:hypothetical protein